jgi:pimeloyl-ACP methyl ester carboxylesterase
MWREQVEALSSDHRVITPDLRGHGETTATNEPATMEMMAADVNALLAELGVARAVVGGLSMGGYVAFAFYELFPQRVESLILADTRAQSDTEEARRTREETAERALNEGMQAIADAMLPKLLAPTTLKQKPEIVARVREMILANKPVGAAAALRGMALRKDQTALLSRIVVPTLILVGNDDVLTPPGDSEVMHDGIRGALLEIIQGAGHLSNIEQPAQFNQALVSFLDERSSAKSTSE